MTVIARWASSACVGLIVVAALLGSRGSSAHEMSIAEMDIRQVAPTDFVWRWTDVGSRPVGKELTPLWPDTCRAEQSALRCGESGLSGILSVDGVGKRYSAAMIKIHWLDGQSRVYTLTAAQPKVRLHGGAEDTRSWIEIGAAYLVLGTEHVLTGVDHLLFVISLIFLVSFNRRLVWTLTAFTLAHSVTLVSSALGWLVLRPPPVEATIALSIVLVAGEALRRRETLARRWPALVAFIFGLVHGLGFAGALKDIGLPDVHLPIALTAFNVGVEAGQLFVVGIAYALWRALSRWPRLELARTAVLYAIGATASYWSLSRVAAMVA